MTQLGRGVPLGERDLMTLHGELALLGVIGDPQDVLSACGRRRGTGWRPGPVALAAAAASAADIIARSPAPRVQFPAAGLGRDTTGPEAAA